MAVFRLAFAVVAVAIFVMAGAIALGATFEDSATEHRVTNETVEIPGSGGVPTTIELNESNRDDATYSTRTLPAPEVRDENGTLMESPDDYRWNRDNNGTLYVPSGSDLVNGTNTSNATVSYSYGTWSENQETLYQIARTPTLVVPVMLIGLMGVAVIASVRLLGGG